jgi:hypothetical protein
LEIQLSDVEAENAMLNGDYFWPVVDIVIGGVPTALEVRYMYLFMTLGRIQLKVSVSTNLFDLTRRQADLWQVDVAIELLGITYLVADLIPTGVQFTALLGRPPSFSICFLVYLAHLHKFWSQGISFGLRHFPSPPGYENIFEGVNTMQGVLHVARRYINVRFILSMDIEF